MSHHYIPWIVGFAFSVGMGHVVIHHVMRVMWNAIDLNPDEAPRRPSPWQPAAQGLVERAMYTAAILTGAASFIAVWLAVKTASTWTSWGVNQEGSTTRRIVQGREVYVNFVLGTALSVSFAAAGAYGTRLLDEDRLTPAFLTMGATTAGAVALAWWIRARGRVFLTRELADDSGERSAETTPS